MTIRSKFNNCLKEIQVLADQESCVANDQLESVNKLLDEESRIVKMTPKEYTSGNLIPKMLEFDADGW